MSKSNYFQGFSEITTKSCFLLKLITSWCKRKPAFWKSYHDTWNCRPKLHYKYKVLVDEDDDELFLWYGWPTKVVSPYFQLGALSEILTITNLWHPTSRIWTCTEPEFRFRWMKLHSSDNHYTTFLKKKNVKSQINIYPRR